MQVAHCVRNNCILYTRGHSETEEFPQPVDDARGVLSARALRELRGAQNLGGEGAPR